MNAMDDDIVGFQAFYDGRRNRILAGYQRLMIAMIEDALRCWQGRIAMDGRVAEEAGAWLFGAGIIDGRPWREDSRALFSCANVCDALGIDIAAFRNRLASGPVELPHNLHSFGNANARKV